MNRWLRGMFAFSLALVLAFAAIGVDIPHVGAAAPQGLAQSVVLGYYDAINNGDYDLAYSYLGAGWHARQSYRNFVNGFADTSYDDVTVTNYYDGPNSSTVYIGLTAYKYDGSVQYYLGSYTLAYEGMYFKIISADIKPN